MKLHGIGKFGTVGSARGLSGAAIRRRDITIRMLYKLTSFVAVLVPLSASAGNWPTWRGPEMNGVSSEKNLPLKWSEKENVRWRVDLPDRGNSSPIVWGNRVFVAQAIEKENRRALMCFDRDNGKLLWQSGVTYTENEATQENNPYCSGTPAAV